MIDGNTRLLIEGLRSSVRIQSDLIKIIKELTDIVLILGLSLHTTVWMVSDHPDRVIWQPVFGTMTLAMIVWSASSGWRERRRARKARRDTISERD